MLVDVEAHFPGTRVTSINGKPVKNLTVADLVDDLDVIYARDNSKKGKAEREQWAKNKAYVETMQKFNSKHKYHKE